MKIKEWIAVGMMLALATASRSLGAPEMSVLDRLEQTEQVAHDIENSIQNQKEVSEVRWAELEKFHQALWRAMALDPTNPALVPPAEVPKALFTAQLNKELVSMFTDLSKSTFASARNVQAEFDLYKQTAGKILDLRLAHKSPEARAIAKRGILDSQFDLLMQKIGKPESQKPEAQKQVQQLLNEIQKTREAYVSQSKEVERKNIFAGSNHKFAWVLIAVFLGFFLGIAAYRISPDFFQRFLDPTEVVGAPSPTGADPKLEYAAWLREFEEHLTRLRNSQMIHERRIGEVVGVSEKITQQALSLYGDARIKNEANLERRMSNLLREIQHQYEQGQKLAEGERTQMQPMLEHCLRLCDALESGGVQVDRRQLTAEQPGIKSAS